MTRSRTLGLVYLSPYIVGLLVFTAIPFLASLYLSFTDYNLMSSPKWTGLENYIDLFFNDRTFRRSLSVTLLYVFITVPLKLAFALVDAVDEVEDFARLRSADPVVEKGLERRRSGVVGEGLGDDGGEGGSGHGLPLELLNKTVPVTTEVQILGLRISRSIAACSFF